MSDKTLKYYNTNAEKFVESRCFIDLLSSKILRILACYRDNIHSILAGTGNVS